MSFTRAAQPALFGLLLTALIGVGIYGALLLALDPGGLFRSAATRILARLPLGAGRFGGLFDRLN
jgi:hypothetical protein